MRILRLFYILFFFCISFNVLAQEDVAAQVKVESVKKESMSPMVKLKGNVIPLYDAVISSEIQSAVTNIALVGTQVEAGQVLATFDDERQNLQLQREQAELASLQAELTFRRAEIKRLQTLANKDNAAKNQLQEALTLGATAEQQVLAATADVNLARRNVRNTATNAPFGGVVVERFSNQGEFIREGDPILRLVNYEAKEVAVPVPIRYQHLLSKGDNLRVEYNNQTLTLSVRDIVRVGDINSRMVELRLVGKGTPLVLGDAVSVFVPTALAGEELVVPRDALVIKGNQTFVYTVTSESRAKEVEAIIKYAVGNKVVLSEGVRAGEQVITRGAERLQPNSLVDIIE